MHHGIWLQYWALPAELCLRNAKPGLPPRIASPGCFDGCFQPKSLPQSWSLLFWRPGYTFLLIPRSRCPKEPPLRLGPTWGRALHGQPKGEHWPSFACQKWSSKGQKPSLHFSHTHQRLGTQNYWLPWGAPTGSPREILVSEGCQQRWQSSEKTGWLHFQCCCFHHAPAQGKSTSLLFSPGIEPGIFSSEHPWRRRLLPWSPWSWQQGLDGGCSANHLENKLLGWPACQYWHSRLLQNTLDACA